MKTLSQQVLQHRKEVCINNFKDTYPEVYNWFQSNYFEELFLQRSSVMLNAEYYADGYLRPLTAEGLPFTDSTGVVELDDIIEYLLCEGFNASIKHGGRWNDLQLLSISLKE